MPITKFIQSQRHRKIHKLQPVTFKSEIFKVQAVASKLILMSQRHKRIHKLQPVTSKIKISKVQAVASKSPAVRRKKRNYIGIHSVIDLFQYSD